MNRQCSIFSVTLFGVLLLMLLEPAFANKFETISSGVNGSFRLKREFLQLATLIIGGGCLLAAVLAVFVPHANAAYLNYANWKASAAVLALLGVALLTGYFFL